MAKKLLIKRTNQAFLRAEGHTWIEKILALPPAFRVSIGICSILIGIIGVFTPIPLGLIGIIIGMILFFGIAKTRNMTFRLIYWLRIHIMYGRFYTWRHHRK